MRLSLPAHIRTIAEQVLTEKQMEAFELECSGWGLMRIGRWLDISKQSVAARIDGAHRKLGRAGVKQDINGEWYMEETNAAA